jgi:[protein-PII] uridylyltransferase
MSRLAAPPTAERLWPLPAEPLPALDAVRQTLIAGDAELARQFRAGTDVGDLLHARAWLAEAAVLTAWRRSCAEHRELALAAVGGFGRGELYPYSDVDLLVLREPSWNASAQLSVERFFAELWDLGLKVGHAVRTLEDCADLARGDLTVATNLFELRRLGGDARLTRELCESLAPVRMWPPEQFARAKQAEQQARHARFNDTAYNLEPNVKEGPGGLRDIHTVIWIAGRALGLSTLEALAERGVLSTEEYDPFAAAQRQLQRVRFALHLAARRPEERLLFEYQRELAREFGLVDEHAQNLAVEQFMQGFFRAAMTIDRLNERLLQRLDELMPGRTAAAPLPIDAEFCSVGGYLDLVSDTVFERHPPAILRAFLVLLDRPDLAGFRSTLLRSLDRVLGGLDDGFRRDPEVSRIFLAIVRHPGPVAEVLMRMNRYGVLGRYLPVFGRVTGRMQYDLFHVYTVDHHTLVVLRNIRQLADATAAQRLPLAHELYARLRKPELLLLAGLFHDIAKGRGGDHSELGEADAREFCLGVGLSATDSDLVAWLVRQHLLMSMTAQKQDIANPSVVHRFAETVADSERLDYLYCLTVSDIRGTNPTLWNSWKDRLLADLHQAARFALARGLEHPVHANDRIAETRAGASQLLVHDRLDPGAIEALWESYPEDSFLRYSAEQLAWQTRTILCAPADALPLIAVRHTPRGGTSEVFVHARDRDGLFATITAVLDRLQLSVVDARVVTSRRGISLDTFQVLEADGHAIRENVRERQLALRLRDELTQPELKLKPARRATSRAQRQFRVPTQVEFSLAPERLRSQLALVCADRPGLLAHVAAVFRELGLRVHDARIATFGERVEDFFELTDESDRPLSSETQHRLAAALRAQIDDGADTSAGSMNRVSA